MNNRAKLLGIIGGALLIIAVGVGIFINRGTISLPSTTITGGRQAQREPLEIPVLPTDVYIGSGIFNDGSGVDLREVRREVIGQLIAQGFSGFITVPYPTSGYNALTASGIGVTYIVNQPFSGMDTLDTYLSGISIEKIKELKISKGKRSTRSNIRLFKSTEDLEKLGYSVVSYRTRTNKDEAYRRTNISQSFKLLGSVRILLPGQQLEFLKNAQYDGKLQKNYLEGYAIIENEEIKVYGGGICGASTAIYQGVVTNKALEPTKLRSHSKWFTNLYTATINGQLVKTPGIDAAIYEGALDFHVKNISTHPIIIVVNYDGSFGGVEEIFSLGYAEDLGSIEYVGGYRTSMEIPDTSPLPVVEAPVVEADSFASDWIRQDSGDDGGTSEPTPPTEVPVVPSEPAVRMKTIYGGCHTRLINGVEKKSCYREIK